MTSSRGDRIRRARELQRLSREELATATGVNAKTIARIERGEVNNSPNATVLERHLKLLDVPAGEHPDDTTPPTLDRQTISAALDQADFFELIAALARRYTTDVGGVPHLPQQGAGGRYIILTEDAPSPDQPAEDQPHAGESGKAP